MAFKNDDDKSAYWRENLAFILLLVALVLSKITQKMSLIQKPKLKATKNVVHVKKIKERMKKEKIS